MSLQIPDVNFALSNSQLARELELHPYRFELLGIDSPNDLMQAKFGSYGEMNKGWSSEEAKGFIKIFSNASRIYQNTNKNK